MRSPGCKRRGRRRPAVVTRSAVNHANTAISAATSWCSSQPTTLTPGAQAVPHRRARGAPGSAPSRGPLRASASSTRASGSAPDSTAFTSASSVSGLHLDVAGAHQQGVAARGNGRDGRVGRQATTWRSPACRGRRSRPRRGSPARPEGAARPGATAWPGGPRRSRGRATCAVMMNATSAAMAARNGCELDGPQAVGAVIDNRQVEVRIDGRVAMAGKVFAAGRHPGPLQRRDDRRAEGGGGVDVGRQGAIANHRIGRIGVDDRGPARSRA